MGKARAALSTLVSIGLLTTSLAGMPGAWAASSSPVTAAMVPAVVSDGAVGLPTEVTQLPETPASHPFNSTRYNKTPLDLSAVGYSEKEFQIGGTANVYDWLEDGTLTSIDSGPYATRILVRQPVRAADFSGNVVVELLNPTSLHDLDIVWAATQQQIIDSGDIWVGVTVKPSSLVSLKEYDAARYSGLSMANPRPDRCTTTTWSGATATTENGLVWDMVSQIGALLQSDDAANPLADLTVGSLLLTGYSQTAGYLTTYINAIAPHGVDASGQPVYDGYLPLAGANFPVPVNQCASAPTPGTSRWVVQPAGDAPVIVLQTLSDFYPLNGFASRRADSTVPGDNYRLYEVAGAGHVWQEQVDYTPSGDELIRAGFTADWWDPYCAQDVTQFPLHYAIRAALANLVDWVRDGKPAPSAPRIEVTNPASSTAVAVTDQFGNVLGGLRLPAIDVPRATYYGTTPGTGTCQILWGHQVPLASYILDRLYPTPGDYQTAVVASVTTATSKGWLTEADGARVLREAGFVADGPTDGPTDKPASPSEPAPADQLTDSLDGGITAPTSARPGDSIEIGAGSDRAGEWVQVWLQPGNVALGTWTQVSDDGLVYAVIPSDTAPRKARLVVQDVSGTVIGWATIAIKATVAPAGSGAMSTTGQLASTGVAVATGTIALAGALVLFGGLLLAAARRRKGLDTLDKHSLL